jgi:hypothetical protein
MVEGLPSGVVGVTFPVVVMTVGVGMVPNGAAGIIEVGDDAGTGTGVREGDGRAGNEGGGGAGMVERGKTLMNDVSGCWENVNGAIALPVVGVAEGAGTIGVIGDAEADGIVPAVIAIDDREVTGTAGGPGVICPDGVEQDTTVPGIAGSEASGTGANVVSGTPGWVVAENGLGPLSGDVTIVPGVDKSPMAVVPMVETCARLALQPNSRAAANKYRMATASSVQKLSLSAAYAPRPCCLPSG